MTKKHFEALAAALRQNEPANGTPAPYRIQYVTDVNMVADVCARFNPTFDRARFLKACGVEN